MDNNILIHEVKENLTPIAILGQDVQTSHVVA
jgi:hypothetical protein